MKKIGYGFDEVYEHPTATQLEELFTYMTLPGLLKLVPKENMPMHQWTDAEILHLKEAKIAASNGIPLGIKPGSVKLITADVDVHGGEDLQPRVAFVEKQWGPALSQYRTKSGGMHMLYKKPGFFIPKKDIANEFGEIYADGNSYTAMYSISSILKACRLLHEAREVDVYTLAKKSGIKSQSLKEHIAELRDAEDGEHHSIFQNAVFDLRDKGEIDISRLLSLR